MDSSIPKSATAEPKARFRPASLDALNFLLADVRGALGPYLNLFLVTQQHWTQSRVGLVSTVAGLLGLAVQTPVGALIDATDRKRGLVAGALAVLAASSVALFALPQFWAVLAASAAMGVVGDLFAPCIAAITLGVTARRDLARRLGRNAAFDHAGNAAIAVAAGALGWAISQRAVFLLAPAFAALAAAAVLSIPAGAIDHDRARGADRDEDEEAPAGGSPWRVLAGSRRLLIFAGCLLLFHFANAPLLPLVGQKLAARHPDAASAMLSACIIGAQVIMLPLSLLVGRTADRIGRKPIMLAAFAVLPVRAALYALSDQTAWLLGVQLLDGVGAGLLGAVTPLVIADVMRGTGRFNVAQGAVATVQGVGAATSGLAAGEIVDRAGYDAGFLSLAAVAAAAFAALAALMPETARRGRGK